MNARTITLAGIFAAVIAVIAPLSIPLPIVPITMQTLIIPLIATISVMRISGWATGLYLILGAVGIPVFANWSGGVGLLFGPTGGYLWGMLLFPLIIGEILKTKRNWFTIVGSNLLAAFVQLLFGTIWLIVATGLPIEKGLMTGFIVFIIPTLLKVAIVVLLAYLIGKSVKIPLSGTK
ncbi:MAG: biotin transporter BioY [Lactobacillaceae bacterium]|jgi:biotin transport system substrate-specific component|nr:biotin transporter BioY [Lactobacillaceae bacterium]